VTDGLASGDHVATGPGHRGRFHRDHGHREHGGAGPGHGRRAAGHRQDLTPANDRYQAYAAAQLAGLARDVAKIQADLRRGDMAAAKQDWLGAQLDWERVGASYNSFGDLGVATGGLPDGLRDGVADKKFQGLHRLEYGLWHGQSAAVLEQVTATLAGNVAAVRKNLGSDDLAGDPANLPVRTHEIIEDALRDHLSGMDDQGGGAAFAQTYAGTQVTRVLLGYLAPLIDARQPGLAATITAQIDSLQQALLATRAGDAWPSLGAAPLAAREHVNAATGALLETVAAVPDLLEVPPAH
jgi:high-affinity iron transporter